MQKLVKYRHLARPFLVHHPSTPLIGQGCRSLGDGAVADGSGMGTRHHSIDGEVLVEPRVELDGTRHVAPVSHEIANDGEQRNNVHTRPDHLVVRDVANLEMVSEMATGGEG
jgi:hypothetical protein